MKYRWWRTGEINKCYNIYWNYLIRNPNIEIKDILIVVQ
jgi:hypothetical protein